MPSASEASRFAANRGVRLHYVVAGAGPPLLLLHGIPDFWNGWRHQIAALCGRYHVAAMDLRGVNLSDKPTEVRNYRIAELVGDVLAVLRDLGAARATLVGHDWGGLLGWWVATLCPDSVERLAVLAAPHPACYLAAREAGEITYRQIFRDQIVAAQRGAPFDADRLSAWISDDSDRAELPAALRRSDPEGIRNYYRANLPTSREPLAGIPPVRAPVLILYGAEDVFIPARYYDLSAKYVAAPCEIVPIPRAGHFIHRESAEQVTAELVRWLAETQ
jgi:pimeloyl-ACP methyl ester carboxylesterase